MEKKINDAERQLTIFSFLSVFEFFKSKTVVDFGENFKNLRRATIKILMLLKRLSAYYSNIHIIIRYFCKNISSHIIHKPAADIKSQSTALLIFRI